MKNIIVFIPAYNCEKQITRVLEQFEPDILSNIKEILVVDNISKDNTLAKSEEGLRKIGDSVKTTLIQNDENYSLGGSIKVAFNYAIQNNYDYLVVLHGDDQADIRDIKNIISSGSYNEQDLVIGARFHKDSEILGYSIVRTLGNKVFNLMCSVITGVRINDMIAGLNIFNMNFLKNAPYLRFPNNLTFDAHLLIYSISKKARIKFVPITWREEDQVSNAKVIKQGLIILRLFLNYFLFRGKLFDKLPENTRDYTYKIKYQNDR